MRATLGTIAVAAGLLAGCGSSSPAAAGGCTPGSTASVAVAAGGFTPRAVCVLPGGTVTFTNQDSVPHDIESGMTCAELNLGPIPAGQGRTATFPTVETCPFFDAAHSTEVAFQGTVAVATAPTTGPGY